MEAGKESSFINIEKMSVPKGGGAYKGLGEELSVDGFTGEARFSLPIYVSPCRGFAPELALSYSAASGADVFGMGFSLKLPSISRKTERCIPTYDDDKDKDIFISSVLGELVPEKTRIDGRGFCVKSYLLRNEGAFAQIEYYRNKDESYWIITDRNNTASIYGKNTARKVDPDDQSRVFSWLISESTDDKGNRIEYDYNSEGLISGIRYGWSPIQDAPCFSLRFTYGDELGIGRFLRYNSGFLIETRRLCESIEMIHDFYGEPRVIRKTNFIYRGEEGPSLLTKIRAIAYSYGSDGSAERMELPALCLEYTGFEPEKGSSGFLRIENGVPFSLGTDGFSMLDLYGEGIPGLLYAHDRAVMYCAPLGNGKYGLPVNVSPFPIDRDLSRGAASLTSLEANGKYELVVHSAGRHGFYEHVGEVWTSFTPFEKYVNDFQGAHVENADLQGDKLSHLCVADGRSLRYYPSLKKKGVGDPVVRKLPEDFPAAAQSSPREAVVFLDIFGDGLQHRVRVRNGSVDCWPNLGYGKFSRKISFKNAPLFGEDFNASRLFFADIDGSGPVDLVYARTNHIEIYFNRGCAFSETPVKIPLPKPLASYDKISISDVIGVGSSCIVLSKLGAETAHYYYDFTKRKKPYLLKKIDNQMGLVTELCYAASTALYIEDGKNWTLKPPFPVQLVVEQRDTDLITGRVVVTDWRYREGYYDFEENAFRGFAAVERKITESIESCGYRSEVCTKSFYHIGTAFDGLKSGFWNKDKNAAPIDAPCFTASSRFAAEKALCGHILREELYGLDQLRPENPYTVKQYNYAVKELIPPRDGHFGSYLVSDRHSVEYAYECEPCDPAVSHDFVLERDDYGNPLRTCRLKYPWRNGEHPLHAIMESYSYANFTLVARHIGVPVESKKYELHGLSSTGYFSFDALKAQIDGAVPVPFGATFSNDGVEARLMEWRREYYWNDDLSEALPLGVLERRLLTHHREEAAFP